MDPFNFLNGISGMPSMHSPVPYRPASTRQRTAQKEAVYAPLTEIPYELKGKIFRSNQPRFGEVDSRIQHLKSQAIDTIVLLTQPREYLGRGPMLDLKERYRQENFTVLDFPIQDYNIPKMKPFENLIEEIHLDAQDGKNIVVHCMGGKGRTGMVLAALAIDVFGFEAKESIEWVRQRVPGAIEDPIQYRFIERYSNDDTDSNQSVY